MIKSGHLPYALLARGRAMSRQKYQRPEVYATGRREKLWRGEWREYYIGADGKEKSRHKSKAWSRANFTKAEAQTELDRIIREAQAGGPKADGSMSLSAFWKQIYYPIRSPKWTPNTRSAVDYVWRLIEPALGGRPLQEVNKSAIELFLLKLAKAGRAENTITAVHTRIHSVMEYALDNDFITKNPARRIQLPKCAPPVETRSLTETEVRTLFERTEGREYLIWRVLLLTGARIGEVVALQRDDMTPDGLRLDQSGTRGVAGPTKNKKTRVAPLPVSLRQELEEWLGTHQRRLVFPSPEGKMLHRSGVYLSCVVADARKITGISDLTFRMCRTTFATLFEGDIADAQKILGHHSAAFTLAVYRKAITERQQASVEGLDTRLRVVRKRA